MKLAEYQENIDRLNSEIETIRTQLSEYNDLLEKKYVLSNKKNISNNTGHNEAISTNVAYSAYDYYSNRDNDEETEKIVTKIQELEKLLDDKQIEENEYAMKIGDLYAKYGN